MSSGTGRLMISLKKVFTEPDLAVPQHPLIRLAFGSHQNSPRSAMAEELTNLLRRARLRRSTGH